MTSSENNSNRFNLFSGSTGMFTRERVAFSVLVRMVILAGFLAACSGTNNGTPELTEAELEAQVQATLNAVAAAEPVVEIVEVTVEVPRTVIVKETIVVEKIVEVEVTVMPDETAMPEAEAETTESEADATEVQEDASEEGVAEADPTATVEPTPEPEATEEPEPTVAPTPTEEVIPVVVSEIPVDALKGAEDAPMISENFAPGDFWETYRDAVTSGDIENEAYVIRINDYHRMNWTFNGRAASDFYYQGEATHVKCNADDHYGLIFRVQDGFNFYLFGINCEGEYRLLRYNSGTFETIVPWTASTAINADRDNIFNVLGVRTVGNSITMYANGEQLSSVEVEDNTFTEGRFGLYSGTRFSNAAATIFDNLLVYRITE